MAHGIGEASGVGERGLGVAAVPVKRRETGNAAVTNALRVSTLLKEIWGSEQVADTGYLRLYMSQLRKKLEADPAAPADRIRHGYRLVTDA